MNDPFHGFRKHPGKVYIHVYPRDSFQPGAEISWTSRSQKVDPDLLCCSKGSRRFTGTLKANRQILFARGPRFRHARPFAPLNARSLFSLTRIVTLRDTPVKTDQRDPFPVYCSAATPFAQPYRRHNPKRTILLIGCKVEKINTNSRDLCCCSRESTVKDSARGYGRRAPQIAGKSSVSFKANRKSQPTRTRISDRRWLHSILRLRQGTSDFLAAPGKRKHDL